MAAKKQVSIKLENQEGKLVEYKAGKIMARTTRDAMKMYSEMEQVDKDGNPVLSEIEQLDMMIDLVADSIFKRVDEVTPEAILDGIEGDKLTDVLQNTIMGAMGITEEDIQEAEEGK
ncbi:MAG: hypothetical protein L0L22_02560 [Staphylococcus equorum]|nr:hypothetical protein [Staphylococcus equorum]MDN6838847.1 hypothetical protein [Staphylococcus equorum]